ncbi:glycosyltransferase family 2 protein [Novipirellula artificiosorum]|uniref:Undecaprenyl-phosphate mannosyltransferase n=1 Tax=Novipirellula artificiosorum TaxID=2528016 RepID=A0A5C6E134_9BACT|nr:glycosyltransferase family 2 protein [Novipirellula artificiosorum]TWU42592.1 Undecaprenyl-phosphate mannosyltransferase [Novipirellula artificiosorum]
MSQNNRHEERRFLNHDSLHPTVKLLTKAQRLWTDAYVDEMETLLGASVCRRLAIFKLPPGFVLSVIVPVFNERNTIATVVDRLREIGIPMQIVLIDDGSDDGTADSIEALASDPTITVLRHDQNLGKGAAIRTGIRSCSGDVIVIQDADQEYDPSDFRYLLQPLLAGEADIAYGTRYGHYDRQLSPWWHQAVNSFITLLASVCIGIRLSDVETCYKMAPRQHFDTILPQLAESRFGIEIEMTARWARRGLRFTERPIRYQHRWYDEGKKIGWRDGVSALWCIVKYGLFKR